MAQRRSLIAGLITTAAALGPYAYARSVLRPASRVRGAQTYASLTYASFLARVRQEASASGIGSSILDDALALERPNEHVLQLDRNQPEATLTWSAYRRRVVTEQRLEEAHAAYHQRLPLLAGIWRRYRVDPRIAVGIWGLESDYGRRSGTFGVVDSLATLAFDGRRAAFFRSELMTSLRILQQKDVAVPDMRGSYAGAMGQPQFMPSSYLRYAVDYDADGRRDIWTSQADVLASICNYLARNGWVEGAPWGQEVALPRGFDPAQAGRRNRRSLGAWTLLGVRRADGSPFSHEAMSGAVLLPEGASGEAFMVYDNFEVIRRYNPSDYYSLAVGLLGGAAG